MNLDGIREALRRRPFVPFSISLVDGRTFDVRHPEFIGIGQRLVTIVADENNWSVVEPLMIVSLDYVLPSDQRTSGAGRLR
jgi:hypothetical protein